MLGQIGALHLQQVMASVGAPLMSKSTFTVTEKCSTEGLQSLFAHSMIEAGREECSFVIEKERCPIDYCRGWSERSHKHSYNSVAVIIRLHT